MVIRLPLHGLHFTEPYESSKEPMSHSLQGGKPVDDHVPGPHASIYLN